MPVLFWGLAVAGSRMLYFFLKKQEIADTYGYFANAMIQMKKNDMAFHSGLAGVYTENLSVLLRFTGNRIEAAGVYQMVLQILWIFLLFTGISLMFGRLAGIISASVLAALPVVLKSILIVWPGNFYMLNFSLILIVLGMFLRRTGIFDKKMDERKEKEKQMQMEEKQDDYVLTEDGRRIKLLDNPLPLPKKHVRKEMDFDFQISDNDDFDI